ncbi:hypothetical protein MTO96_018930 [Rhipicephalus appendiculatus]
MPVSSSVVQPQAPDGTRVCVEGREPSANDKLLGSSKNGPPIQHYRDQDAPSTHRRASRPSRPASIVRWIE